MRSRYTSPFTKYVGKEVVSFITAIVPKLHLTDLEHIILMCELDIQHRRDLYGEDLDE